jgi:4-amino-4-deoxy-L-arabinose transferase-like glycosyltransferase/membrane-associated phospholipid phosphatase
VNLSAWDTSLFFLINRGLQSGVLDVVMPFVTDNAKLLFLPLAAWFLAREKREALPLIAIAAVSIAFADGSGNLLKHLFARERPCAALAQVHLLAGCGGFSFPSNHAANAFAFAMSFWFLRRNAAGVLCVVVASLVGISRVYVGVHYPSDVVAGALVGSAAAYGTLRLHRWAVRIYKTESYSEALYFAILLFSLFRVYYIVTGPFDLSADEAHYWEWSRRLDLSYYSKGPMIAYLIYAGTALFGDNVFGVRVLAVLLSALSSVILFRLGRELYDERTGFASALLVQIVPLYSVYGIIFTIDSPLIFFWILSLFLFWKAMGYVAAVPEGKSSVFSPSPPPSPSRGEGHNSSADGEGGDSYILSPPLRGGDEGEGENISYWVLLGLAVGLGLLSKYTMALFYLSALLFLALRRDSRKLLATKGPYVAFIVSIAVFSPVIIWNSLHGWVTLKHTAGQAHLEEGLTLSVRYFFEFLGSQLGVVTPVLLVMILIASWKLRKEREGAFLFWFSLPVIIFFLIKSVQGKVQANWALPGYAAGFIAFSAYYVRDITSSRKPVKFLSATAALLALAVTCVAYSPSLPGLPAEKNPSKKLMGWKELGKETSRLYREVSSGEGGFVFSDSYQLASELAFYMKGHPVTYCINTGERRMDQYDIWPGFERLIGYNALFVMEDDQEMPEIVAGAFARYEKVVLALRPRNGRTMKFTVFKCYDFKGMKTIRPETY